MSVFFLLNWAVALGCYSLPLLNARLFFIPSRRILIPRKLYEVSESQQSLPPVLILARRVFLLTIISHLDSRGIPLAFAGGGGGVRFFEPKVGSNASTRQVAAGLTHNPDGGTLGLFTASGAEDKVVLEGREGDSVGHGEENLEG